MVSRALCRSEIADLIEVTVDQARHNEKRWGILAHRRTSKGPAVYLRGPTMKALKRLIGQNLDL